MRLHYHPTSPYSRKAAVAIAHRGDPCQRILVDVRAGGLRSPAFLELSPFGKMPVLETDDEGPIYESTSILEYLEARGPRVLLPEGQERRARHWDRVGDLYLVESQSVLLFRPTAPEAEIAEQAALRAWRLVDDALADDRDFLCGDRFGMADLSAAIGTDYLRRMGLAPPDRVAAWCDRCFDVDAMRSELEEALPLMEVFLQRRRDELARR